ncbi:TetR/AcrR family transcriptional regulator [Nocardiopsis sp. ARC36]
MPSSQRRRPTTRKGRPVLTREIIATKALEMAGAQGFRAITMHALAAELGVTVRALYNYVENRRQVIDLTVDLMLDAWNPPPLDPGTWEDSVAAHAQSLRALYRRWPRALLVAVDEDTPPTSVHPNRLTNLDRFLTLLRDIGLDTTAALDVHRHLSLLVFSFALMVDHPADRATTANRPLIPAPWLEEHTDLDIPTLREAAALPTPSPDEQFQALIALITTQVRSHLHSR